MEKDFEMLITSFLENNIGVADNFLSNCLADKLKINLQLLHQQNLLSRAGTGNAEKLTHDTSVRSDGIYWLDRKNDSPCENEFFDLVEDFIKYLNLSCYAGITTCEFHYSLYEPGSFYKKHIDQFQNNSRRKYSLISYLNADWQKEDGGELLIHQGKGDEKISPMQGKTIFFKSNELEHEVLVTHKQRMSITGWLKGN